MNKENILSIANPELAKQWHPTKNGDLTPNDVTIGQSKIVWWKCDVADDHEWPAAVKRRNTNKTGCRCCNGKQVSVTNSLVDQFPEIAKEWHPTKNNEIEPKPLILKEMIGKSSKKAWWKCSNINCNHEWSATISNRTVKNTGCPKCSTLSRTDTTETFIAKSKIVHGENLFGYDRVEYILSKIKVELYCFVHNIYFFTLPSDHLNKSSGCPTCGQDKRNISKTKTTEQVIKDAEDVHGKGTYGYDRFIYYHNSIPSEIYCFKHKEYFWQRPNNHINSKQGCPKCRYVKSSAAFRRTHDEFVKDAQAVHGVDRYNYDYFIYKNTNTPSEIFCNRHHRFFSKAPYQHINRGFGCPDCTPRTAWSRTDWIEFCQERNIKECIFYAIRIYNKLGGESFVKLGITSRTVKKRYKDLKSETNEYYEYNSLFEIKGVPEEIWDIENKSKKIFAKYKYNPFLNFGGFTECYKETILHLPEFKKIFQ